MHNYSLFKTNVSIEKMREVMEDKRSKPQRTRRNTKGSLRTATEEKSEYEAGRLPEMLATLFHPAELLLQEFIFVFLCVLSG